MTGVTMDASGCFTMLVCRVSLGTPAVLRANFAQGRPPCRQAGCGSAVCAHPRHDSVLADVPAMRFREFVVFERAQCYPELVVRYRRA